MKKLLPILLLLVLLTGCFNEGPDVTIPSETPAPSDTNVPSDLTMAQIIDLICQDVEVPAYEAAELTDENFEYSAFIPYEEGLTGYKADALINATAHSLVLIHSENGNTADLAQKILDNANPFKWICVSAEVTQTAYTEHYVILVMSSAEIVEGLIDNFQSAVNDGDVTILDSVSVDLLAINSEFIAD